MIRSFLVLVLLTGCSTAAPVKTPAGAVLQGQPGEVVVLVFGSPDCPISNALAPEYNRVHELAKERSARFYLVHPRPDVTMDMAKQHAKEYKLTMPLILDPDYELVGAMKATVTPEAVVLRFDKSGQPVKVYQGQVNDLYASLGNRREHATRAWLQDAIIAASDGSMVEVAYRKPIGCFIEPRRP